MLGLFASEHMPYNIEKKSDSDKPSLEEMVGKALDVMEKDKKGFFLFVEGKALLSHFLVVSSPVSPSLLRLCVSMLNF